MNVLNHRWCAKRAIYDPALAASSSCLAEAINLGYQNMQVLKKEEVYLCPHGLPESC